MSWNFGFGIKGLEHGKFDDLHEKLLINDDKTNTEGPLKMNKNDFKNIST